LKYYLNDESNCYYRLNVKIMVRIKGLCRALGRVIGRALGREHSGDADESPQQRRPTTSAHVGNGQLHLLLRMLNMWIM